MCAALLRSFFSPSIYTGILISIGGVALACANLILAKILSPDAFGSVVLFQAIASVAIGLAPLGFDSLVIRGEIRVNWHLMLKIMIVVCSFSALFAYANFLLNTLTTEIEEELLFGLACLGGAIVRLCAATEQTKGRFWLAQLINQAPSLCFLLFSGILLLFESPTWQLGVIAFVLGQLVGAVIGLSTFDKDSSGQPRIVLDGFWLRAVSLLGVIASVQLLSQLERFVIAGFLELGELATFGVAATLILSPFRILSSGIVFTLTPRLAANPTRSIRRNLLLQELHVAVVLGTLGGIVLYFIAPPLVHVIYQDKFSVSPILVIALVIAGLIRTAYAFVSACIGGTGDTHVLGRFNLYGWLGAGVAGVAAIFMSSAGIPGVVAGVSLGWLIRICAGILLIRSEQG